MEQKQCIEIIHTIREIIKGTSFRENLSQHGYVHINLDTLLHTRHKESLVLAECLEENRSFVVDNNTEKTDRMRYIPQAKEHGYEVIGIFFQSIVCDCIAGNENREKDVPLQAIPRTQNLLQFPSYDEGFDALYFAKIIENGFEISEWRD